MTHGEDDWSAPIRARAEAQAAAIGVPASEVPRFGLPERNDLSHDMKWWISRTPRGFRLFWFERGAEFTPTEYADAEETLYRFFVHQSEWMARERLKGKPKSEKDERIPIGRLQAEMLGRASTAWKERREREVAADIAAHPYRDPPHPFAHVPYYYLSSNVQDVTGDSWQARRSTADQPAE